MSGEPIEVSVVIPTFNSEHTIGPTLESLTKQRTGRSWEVVVADNGSDDGTVDVVESFRDRLPKLTLVDTSDKRGISHARNRASAASTGPYLAFLDADDQVSENWVEGIARALERVESAATPRDHALLNEPWVQETRDPPTPDGIQQNWFPPYLPHTGAGGLGIRRELHEQIGGFDETFIACEDNDYCFRIQLAGGRLGSVEGAFYYYRFKDSMRGIFRQAFVYAEETARLQRRYRQRGVRPIGAWKWPFRYWPTIAKTLPTVYRKGGRARLAWVVGWELGRYSGSFKHRVFSI
jgi:glycosyltransferase involved in cell wall biosynthesis